MRGKYLIILLLILKAFLFTGCITAQQHYVANDMQIAKQYVKDGKVNIHAPGGIGINSYDTALHIALTTVRIKDGNLKKDSKYNIAKYLIKEGKANVNAKGWNGQTPLIRLFSYNNGYGNNKNIDKDILQNQVELAKLLIDNGANVNAKDYYGETVLHRIVSKYKDKSDGSYSMRGLINLILKKGLDIDSKNNRGFTALASAMNMHNPKYVRYLLLKGADPFKVHINTELYVDNEERIVLRAQKRKKRIEQRERERKRELAKAKRVKEKRKQELVVKSNINKLIKDKNLNGLKNYINENPSYYNLIESEPIKLMLTGPKDLTIGDIVILTKDKLSEAIILAQIERVKKPYKNFSMDEIKILQSVGLTDKVIAKMISISAQLEKNDKKIQQQQELIKKQQSMLNNRKTKVIYRDKNNGGRIDYNSATNKFLNAAGNEIGKEVGKKVAEKLIKEFLF